MEIGRDNKYIKKVVNVPVSVINEHLSELEQNPESDHLSEWLQDAFNGLVVGRSLVE